MKAVIMAGGEGTRLRPLTCHIPKPMVPVANTPVMEHIINLLKKHNITEIATTLYYMPNIIVDYFQDGSKLGVNLKYFIEETPLGTGGSVLNTDKFLDDTFIVISGDAYTNIDLTKAVEYHKAKKSKATLILKKQSIPIEYGIVITDEQGKIIRFLEKPSWGEVFSDTVNTGIYILEPEVFNYYKKGENFDFSKDLFPKLLKDNIPMYGYITDEYWCDIGDINSYRQTNFDVVENFLSDKYTKLDEGIFVGKNTIIPKGVNIKSPCIIGDNTHIGEGCRIDAYTIIGNNCYIDSFSSIKRTIIWDNVKIGKSVECRGSIICDFTKIQDSVHIYEATVIGKDTLIEKNSTIKPGVKIWPDKYIPTSSIVNRNIIWGTKPQRIKFTENGIEGEFNIEITPESASLIGSAFASICNKHLPILVCTDGSRPSTAIKQSIIAGIISSGIKVLDLEHEPINVLRYGVRFYKGSAGIYISSKNNNNIINIQFINELGANIDRKTEKKLDQIFIREDFQRCSSYNIGSIINIKNFYELYIQNNINNLKDVDQIKIKSPKVLIASQDERGALITSILLETIGCKVSIDYNINNFNNINDYFKYFSEQVKNNFLFGAVINKDCESFVLFDEQGNIISQDTYRLLTTLISIKLGEQNIIVPYTASLTIDKLADDYNVKVTRTKSNRAETLNQMLSKTDNLSLNPQYILNYDAILSTAYLTAFLVKNNVNLSSIINNLPQFYLKHHELPCAFTERGRIIRQLIEQNNPKNMELYEGVKLVSDKGYAIILPDDHRPILKIYIEGFNQEFAEEISSEVVERLKKMLKNS